MRKEEFLKRLRKRLSGLPDKDTDERISFYSEIIDDRIEDGLTEEEAVAAIGTVDSVVEQIINETPIKTLVNQRIKPKRKLKTAEIILLICTSPLWLSLLLSAFAVVLALYVSLWSVIISLIASSVSVAASGAACAVFGIFSACSGNWCPGLAIFGAGLVLLGLSIFMFYGCKWATRTALLLTKKLVYGIKLCFIGKGEK